MSEHQLMQQTNTGYINNHYINCIKHVGRKFHSWSRVWSHNAGVLCHFLFNQFPNEWHKSHAEMQTRSGTGQTGFIGE